MNTFPALLGTLCVLALAYRYCRAFTASEAPVPADRGTTLATPARTT